MTAANAKAEHPLNRHLFIADNLDLLRRLDNESVDLVCIDPPFKKRRTFVGRIKPPLSEADLQRELATLAGWGIATPQQAADAGINWPTNAGEARFKDAWSYREDVHEDWVKRIETQHESLHRVIEAAKVTSGMDTAAYLCYMAVRLIEMHRVLKPTGSLYLHCDGDANSYLRLALDAIFGDDNRRNQIAWKRTNAPTASDYQFGCVHDTILAYAKTSCVKLNPVYIPYSEEYIRKNFRYRDKRGQFQASPLTAQGTRNGHSGKPWRGIDVTARGLHWASPTAVPYGITKPAHYDEMTAQEKLDWLDGEGLIYWPPKGSMPRFKHYLSTTAGARASDFITDIPAIQGASKEGTGYPTQKPVALAERIIKAATNPGDVVLDCFAGCAYVPVAAERNGRQWIACDISPRALTVLRRQFAKFRYAVDGEQQTAEPALLTEADVVTRGPYNLPERSDEDPEPRIDMKEPPPVAYKTPASIIPEPEMLRRLLELSDYKAWCCGFANRRPDGSIVKTTRNFHLDHLNPKSKEGTSNQIINRAPMCPHHNTRKNNRRVHLAEYRQEIAYAEELMVDSIGELVNLTWAGDQALEIYARERAGQVDDAALKSRAGDASARLWYAGPVVAAERVPFTGDAREVAEFNERMARFRAANSRLREDKAALTVQYPDQYVAMDENGLVAVARTSSELAAQLKELGRHGDAIAIGFMTTKPKRMIL